MPNPAILVWIIVQIKGRVRSVLYNLAVGWRALAASGRGGLRLKEPRTTLSRLLNGRASFTAARSLRLSDAFGTEPGMWLDLQRQYDLWQAARRKRPKVEKFFRLA